MLIGLNGRLKSGKDTTFEVIKGLYPNAERLSFADPLKDSAAQALGISRELLEILKNHEEIHMEIPTSTVMSSSLSSEGKAELAHWKLNGRVYLQRYGTEAHREIFGDDFWVDQTLPEGLNHIDKLLVVTDMRFPNEAQRVLDLGVVTIKIVRDVKTAHSAHLSEQNIDHMMKYELDNTGSLDALTENVQSLMLKIAADTNAALDKYTEVLRPKLTLIKGGLEV